MASWIICEWGTCTGAIRRLRFELVNIEIMQYVFIINAFIAVLKSMHSILFICSVIYLFLLVSVVLFQNQINVSFLHEHQAFTHSIKPTSGVCSIFYTVMELFYCEGICHISTSSRLYVIFFIQ